MSKDPEFTVTRLASRLAALVAATFSLLLLAVPAMAAEGTTPIPGEHDGVIGSSAGILWAAIAGIVLGAVAFAMLPAAGPDDHDDHH